MQYYFDLDEASVKLISSTFESQSVNSMSSDAASLLPSLPCAISIICKFKENIATHIIMCNATDTVQQLLQDLFQLNGVPFADHMSEFQVCLLTGDISSTLAIQQVEIRL